MPVFGGDSYSQVEMMLPTFALLPALDVAVIALVVDASLVVDCDADRLGIAVDVVPGDHGAVFFVFEDAVGRVVFLVNRDVEHAIWADGDAGESVALGWVSSSPLFCQARDQVAFGVVLADHLFVAVGHVDVAVGGPAGVIDRDEFRVFGRAEDALELVFFQRRVGPGGARLQGRDELRRREPGRWR